MRGANAVLGFGAFGICAFVLLSFLSGHHGFCGEKPIGACPAPVDADPASLVGLITLGLFGLFALMLLANGIFALLRYRRRND